MKISSARPHLMVVTVTLLLLAACGVSPTPALNPAPAETAMAEFIATPAPLATATAAWEISPAASAYLEAAIEIMQTNGINRHHVDWNAVRTEAFQQAQQAQTPADTYSAIRYVLREAGGGHSSFLTPDAFAQWRRRTMSDNPAPRGKLLLGKLGFVAIEGFSAMDPDEETKYATRVQQIIRDLDALEPCGWLVDLQENTGGNMWPMLAGLGPILGEGKAGAFVDPDGHAVDWSYREGQALSGDDVVAQVTKPAYQLKAAAPPVAVLSGINTASSGEAIVVSFRERPQTRSFGRYCTAGLSTGNASFPLSDGAALILTTVVFADRTGHTYGDRICPDEVVNVGEFTRIMEEFIPRPAVDWLMAQSACAAQK